MHLVKCADVSTCIKAEMLSVCWSEALRCVLTQRQWMLQQIHSEVRLCEISGNCRNHRNCRLQMEWASYSKTCYIFCYHLFPFLHVQSAHLPFWWRLRESTAGFGTFLLFRYLLVQFFKILPWIITLLKVLHSCPGKLMCFTGADV